MPDNYYEQALLEADSSDVNDRLVLELLDKAAERGDERAIFARASCYEDGKFGSAIDTTRSNSMFRTLKNSTIPEALFAIAYCYDVGDGVKKNYKAAFSYYLKAAVLGHCESNHQVAEFYREGKSVERNAALQRFFTQRAKLGELDISPPQRVFLRAVDV